MVKRWTDASVRPRDGTATYSSEISIQHIQKSPTTLPQISRYHCGPMPRRRDMKQRSLVASRVDGAGGSSIQPKLKVKGWTSPPSLVRRTSGHLAVLLVGRVGTVSVPAATATRAAQVGSHRPGTVDLRAPRAVPVRDSHNLVLSLLAVLVHHPDVGALYMSVNHGSGGA